MMLYSWFFDYFYTGDYFFWRQKSNSSLSQWKFPLLLLRSTFCEVIFFEVSGKHDCMYFGNYRVCIRDV